MVAVRIAIALCLIATLGLALDVYDTSRPYQWVDSGNGVDFYFEYVADAPITNWYDYIPYYTNTVLVARFNSSTPLTNEAESVTGGIINPGGGAAPALTNDFATFGGNDYLDCGDSWTNYGCGTAQNYAVSFWVSTFADVANAAVYSCVEDNDRPGGEIQFGDIDSLGYDMCFFPHRNESTCGMTNIATKVWYHAAVTYDRQSDIITWYSNGVPTVTRTITGGPLAYQIGKAGTAQWIGGRARAGGQSYLNGAVDDLIQWVFPVSSTQIIDAAQMQSLYNAGRSSD